MISAPIIYRFTSWLNSIFTPGFNFPGTPPDNSPAYTAPPSITEKIVWSVILALIVGSIGFLAWYFFKRILKKNTK